MGIKNAIRKSTRPDPNDLEGWKSQMEYFQNQFEFARSIVSDLETEATEPSEEPKLEDDSNATA